VLDVRWLEIGQDSKRLWTLLNKAHFRFVGLTLNATNAPKLQQFWQKPGANFLNKLILDGMSIKSLGDIIKRDLPVLETLSLGGCKHLHNIEAARKCIELRVMNLAGCIKLASISALSECKKLECLHLAWCSGINDLSPLSSTPRLHTLNLQNTNVKHLGDLAGHPALRHIVQVGQGTCPLTDLSALGDLPVLTTASFLGSSIKHLKLEQSRTLKKVSASANFASSKQLVRVSAGPGLEELDVSSNAMLTDLGGLRAATGLKTLDLSNCSSLTNASPLVACNSLSDLDISSCTSLADISALGGCDRLETIDISSCTSLADISALGGCDRLETIKACRCKKITDISALAGLASLRQLDIRDTAVPKEDTTFKGTGVKVQRGQACCIM